MALNFYSELLPSHTIMCIEYETELLLLYIPSREMVTQPRELSLGISPTHDMCMIIEVR